MEREKVKGSIRMDERGQEIVRNRKQRKWKETRQRGREN